MPTLIFSVHGSFSLASKTLEDLSSRYRSLRISLRKEYIYLVFQESLDLEMFAQDAKEGKLPQFTQEVFEVLGTSEDQLINQCKPSASHPSQHEPQTAQTYQLENSLPVGYPSDHFEEKPADSQEREGNKVTKISEMVIENEVERTKEQNYSGAKQQAPEQQFIPVVEEPTQELQLQFEAEPAIVLKLPKQQTKQTKEQATHQPLSSEKQQQPQPEIKTIPTEAEPTQLLPQGSLKPEEHAEGTCTQTSKITSETYLNEGAETNNEYHKEEGSSISQEKSSSQGQDAQLAAMMEKSMLPESSEGTRNRVSFKTKSAYVFAVLTVWILWIVY